jgi:tRNA pseudouridine38-40 synthase
MSSRTDKNVHALNQVFHLDLPIFWTDNLNKFKFSFQKMLPPTIQIKNIEIVSNKFHSRFDAKARFYRYIFSLKPITPFDANFKTEFDLRTTDINKIKSAIKLFEGIHNFENFKKTGSISHSNIREIYKTKAYIYKNNLILGFNGNSFLRSQVRMMVNFLIKIGKGEKSENQLIEQLNLEKIHCRKLAPPNGLYLFKVIY